MQKSEFVLHAELEDEHWWFKTRRSIIEQQVKQYFGNKTGLLAEIGCGTGGNLKSFSASGWRVVGVDTNIDAVSYARSRVANHNIHAGDFQTAFADTWPEINVLLLADVLEHVDQDETFLHNAVQPLSPGTYIIITVPALQLLWSQHDTVLGHYRRYDQNMLKSLIEQTPDLKLCFMSYFNSVLFPAVAALRFWQRFFKPQANDASDLKKHSAFLNHALEKLFSIELPLLRKQITLPIGTSLLAVLQKH